ncbi:MaoC family dehydratase [Rhodococcus daqingensis]|uniref:MaoC family dehydratase n=1 Tax=Rhodococcus daqingensis TaxID=2479363 RepID=A0ABW2S0D7_9NOCA
MGTQINRPTDLLSLVGRQLGTTDWQQITQDQVNLFADATGDHQWIHTDPQRAAAGPFGGTIAHGYLTLSLIPRALNEVLTIDTLEAALNYGLNKVRFPAPVLVGAQVRATVALVSAQQKPGGVEAVFGVAFEAENVDRPACVAECVAVYR